VGAYGAGYVAGPNQIVNEPVPGDYNYDNYDGVVDAADYVVWRNGLGTTYTQTDYDVWRANFGQTSANGSALPSAEPLCQSQVRSSSPRWRSCRSPGDFLASASGRRVLAGLAQDSPQVHNARAIELQLFDRGPPDRRQTLEEKIIMGPRQMVRPFVRAGMKQSRGESGERVDRLAGNKFGVVASLARERKV
jgi:hypothetical protein